MRSSVRGGESPSSPGSGDARYSVSCMSRAGCSAGMFSASKQCHSSSTSGPSTTANPMRVKISSRRSRTIVSGWRWPSRRRAAGQRDVNGAGRHPIARGFFVSHPARIDRLLQLVCPASDLLLLVGRRRPNHLHPRRDDAVLAAEETVAHGLRVAGRLRLREVGLELRDQPLDRFWAGKDVGHEVVSRQSTVVQSPRVERFCTQDCRLSTAD